MVPDAVDVVVDLLAVRFAHVVHGELFAGAFKGVAFGADEGHFDRQAVEHLLEEHGLGADATELHHAGGVEEEAVGHGGQEVALLGVDVGIGVDGFAAFGEVGQGLTQFLAFAPGEGGAGAHIEIEAVDAFVGGGLVDGTQEVVEAPFGGLRHQLVEFAGSSFGEGLGEVDFKEGMVGDDGLFGRIDGADDAKQHEQFEESDEH